MIDCLVSEAGRVTGVRTSHGEVRNGNRRHRHHPHGRAAAGGGSGWRQWRQYR
jgi:hypothetical protein